MLGHSFSSLVKFTRLAQISGYLTAEDIERKFEIKNLCVLCANAVIPLFPTLVAALPR
jgi:hypothetical protein